MERKHEQSRLSADIFSLCFSDALDKEPTADHENDSLIDSVKLIDGKIVDSLGVVIHGKELKVHLIADFSGCKACREATHGNGKSAADCQTVKKRAESVRVKESDRNHSA